MPFEKWMQGRLRDEIGAVLGDGGRIGDAGLIVDGVRDVWRKFLQKPRATGWSRPWALYSLARWCEINKVAA